MTEPKPSMKPLKTFSQKAKVQELHYSVASLHPKDAKPATVVNRPIKKKKKKKKGK